MIGPETTRFIEELADNNERDWFKANESRYKQHYKLAGEAFAETLGFKLSEAMGTSFVPRNFRIFRDVRFSKDKTPYNPHLRMGFKQPEGAEDRPFLMAGLQLGKLVIGVGRFGFEKNTLTRFREEVAGPAGEELSVILEELVDEGARLSNADLKRVPAPYDKDHPRADLLRHKGLAVWRDYEGHELAYGDDGPDKVAAEIMKLRPIHDWLTRLAG